MHINEEHFRQWMAQSGYTRAGKHVRAAYVAQLVVAAPTSEDSGVDFEGAEERNSRVVDGNIPFEYSTATPEILTFVAGRTLTWYNRLGKRVEEAQVLPGKHLKLVEYSDGRKVLSFNTKSGFRSVSLEQLLSA